MTMKTISLQLHFSPAEALTLIEVLDQLRDAIAAEYVEDIRLMFADELEDNSDQLELPFDDPIDF